MVNLVAAGAGTAVQSTFPRKVREVEHFWIPMSDGTRLAARMWLPEDAEASPVPAVIEYIPYRQGDFTAPRDRTMHPYFAGYGYAAIRVDIRGSGNSEGVPMDEYVEQEQDDALDMLAWISSQPWCSGQTGLIGISWGGFAALQIAARRPPSLKAIITVCSTDDRYGDDVHYMGGCLLSNNLSWGGVMYGYMLRPPDPAIVGERWRDMWKERIEGSPVALADWMQHSTRDAYWQHGSVCEDYEAIECAVYAVGGWTDGYSNAVPRLLEHLSCPRRGLVGPWAHGYPHIAAPGPTIGFLQDATRWWDRWLKGEANGIDNEPMLYAWMQAARAPASSAENIDGRWVTETCWPPSTVQSKSYFLGDGRLEDEAVAPTLLSICSPVETGAGAGEWCPHGIGPELAVDQRLDDAVSLVFDTAPLSSPVEILGAAVLNVRVGADKSKAMLAARLSCVAPDGKATRVSFGLLNLAHRDSHSDPGPLVPGQMYPIRLQLNDIAQVFPAGCRIRLSLSSAHWPMAWPSPQMATLALSIGDATLTLPVREPASADEEADAFLPPVMPAYQPVTQLREVGRSRRLEHDLVTGESTLSYVKDDGAYRLEESALEVDARGTEVHSICRDDPLSARSVSSWCFEHRRDEWLARVEVSNTLNADGDTFVLETRVRASEGDTPMLEDVTRRKIPRGFL